MEYIENAFKIGKETKHNTVLRKAKKPKGKSPLPSQIRAESCGEKELKPKPNDL